MKARSRSLRLIVIGLPLLLLAATADAWNYRYQMYPGLECKPVSRGGNWTTDGMYQVNSSYSPNYIVCPIDSHWDQQSGGANDTANPNAVTLYEVAVYTWTASNCDLIGTICGRPIMGGTSVICNWYEPCAQQSGDSYMILSPLGLNDSQLGLYVELYSENHVAPKIVEYEAVFKY
jgi:hypothetical protein